MNAADAGAAQGDPTTRAPAAIADPPGARPPGADPMAADASAGPAAELALPRGCPFLLAADGGWRLDLPSREHRCAAFSPAAPLAPEKQARLCLTPTHTTCATYLASMAAREARLGAPPADRATRWGLARTTTVIVEPGGVRARLLGAVLDRRRWPAIPAVLLVTTLFALALSGFRAENPATAVATSSPGAPTAGRTEPPAPTPAPTQNVAASAIPSEPPAGTPTPAPTAPPTAPPTEPPTAAPTPRPSPTFRTYVVESGDTLSAIAARFNTTVQAIVDLNNLPDANRLSVGQILLIP